jgi:hypothetical protein
MPGASVSRLAATILIAVLFVAEPPDGGAQILGAQSQITGTWRGTSECVQKESTCHAESNVYRFTELASKPGWFSGTGSKVLNGKEISMGTLEWQYEPKGHILESRNPNGVFRFVISADKIEGTLFLPDSTPYRRIRLTKIH